VRTWIVVTIAAILALIVLGVLLIHRFDSQHDERITAFHYGRSRSPVRGRVPSVPQRARGRAGARGIGDRIEHRDGGCGRPRPRRRIWKGMG
jgi:hypothetical protein